MRITDRLRSAYRTIETVSSSSAGPSRTAPKTTKVTAPSTAPASSTRCATSPAVSRRRAWNVTPPTKAPMKPEPPIGVAMPQARPAAARGTICSQACSVCLARSATRIAAAAAAPAITSGERAVSDLLGHQPRGRSVSDRAALGGRDRQHDQEHRDADAVVEAALHVQALPHPHRQARQRHHRLPERRVGGREDHSEQERLGPGEPPEQRERDHESRYQGQRQADAEQPCGYRELATEGPQVDAGGVGEQHNRQRGLRELLHRVARAARGR